MPVPPSNPQDTLAAIAAAIIIGAVICARYWRTVLVAAVIAMIALTVWGTVVGIDAVTSLMGAHRR
jgi:hypothetical protein